LITFGLPSLMMKTESVDAVTCNENNRNRI
jgi:hypothetical protein